MLITFQPNYILTPKIATNLMRIEAAKEIGKIFGFQPRTRSKLCQNWVEAGFLEIADPSNKNRKYKLSKNYQELVN